MKQIVETVRYVQVATLLMHFINVLNVLLVTAQMDNIMIRVKINVSVARLNVHHVLVE